MNLLNLNFPKPQISKSEILRYANCKAADISTSELLETTLDEIEDKISYKVCSAELSVKISGDLCDFEVLNITSKDLAKNLENCKTALVFTATLGTQIDRMIKKYSHISPAKALMLQAIGAERIEALCDDFCKEYARNNGVSLRPRYSPGYGDLPLEFQKDIFAVLNCEKNIGVTLNGSLIMSPSKSVTAIVGIL